MSSSEQERVHEILADEARGSRSARKLVWDPMSKRIQASSDAKGHGDMLQVNPSDMNHYAHASFLHCAQGPLATAA